jgi:hypothetical protein
LPLFGKLHPKLHRVHGGSCESACIRPRARRASESIADEALIGLGDLICSSHMSII